VQFIESSENGYTAFYNIGVYSETISVGVNVLSRENGAYFKSYVDLYTENGQWNENKSEASEFCKNVKVTDSGYLITYENEEALKEGSADFGYRIYPLAEENVKAYGDYVALVDTIASGVLSENWSEEANFKNLEWEFVFERIIFAESGISMQNEDGLYYAKNQDAYEGFSIVPADVFESTIQKYFNVSTEDLRKIQARFSNKDQLYNPQDNTYTIWGFRGGGYSPITEVWDVKNNSDGSVSITIAYASPDFGHEYISSVLTVLPQEDGGYKYISNVFSDENIKNKVNNLLELAESANYIYIGEFITKGESIEQNGYNYAEIDYENGDFWDKIILGGLSNTESIIGWFDLIFTADAAQKYLDDIFTAPLYINGGTEDEPSLMLNLDKKNPPIAAGEWSTDSFEVIENTPEKITVKLKFTTDDSEEEKLLTMYTNDNGNWQLTDSYEGTAN